MIDPMMARAAIKALADKYTQDVSVNDMATSQRMGGKFTPMGLEKASKEAQLNAIDRLKAKELLKNSQMLDTGN